MSTETNRTGEECPVCGEGCLTSHIRKNEVEYGGQLRALDLHYSTCDYCQSDIAGNAEAKLNARAMTAFKKEVDGLLSGAEIKRFRDIYDLTQDTCASLFGGGVVAFSRYENDDIMQSRQMDRLLRLCIQAPENIHRMAELSNTKLSTATYVAIRKARHESNYWKSMIDIATKAFDKPFTMQHQKLPKSTANDNVFTYYGKSKSSVIEQQKFEIPEEMAA
jgi:HTH-type transcriptional regulator / antitoxin MqsA